MKRIVLLALFVIGTTGATCSRPIEKCVSHYDCDQNKNDILFDHVCDPDLGWCVAGQPKGTPCDPVKKWKCAAQQCVVTADSGGKPVCG